MHRPTAALRHDSPLRSDVLLANLNAGLWAIGSGLAPTLLVLYFAINLQATGLVLSWVLAAPRFAGVLRLLTPTVIARLGSCKLLCVVAYAASGVTLGLLPLLSSPLGWVPHDSQLLALVLCWCLYQVLEYFGTTALWSWLGDLYPPRLRGRLIAGANDGSSPDKSSACCWALGPPSGGACWRRTSRGGSPWLCSLRPGRPA